jgi:hypothetical protein
MYIDTRTGAPGPPCTQGWALDLGSLQGHTPRYHVPQLPHLDKAPGVPRDKDLLRPIQLSDVSHSQAYVEHGVQ